MKLLTKELQESCENPKIHYIWKKKKKKKKKIEKKYVKYKKYHKVRNHCHYTGEYRGAAHSICSLK